MTNRPVLARNRSCFIIGLGWPSRDRVYVYLGPLLLTIHRKVPT